jgi:hypothetical protein
LDDIKKLTFPELRALEHYAIKRKSEMDRMKRKMKIHQRRR